MTLPQAASKLQASEAGPPRVGVLSEIRVETINGQPAVQSPFADDLKAFGFTSEYRELSLRRRF